MHGGDDGRPDSQHCHLADTPGPQRAFWIRLFQDERGRLIRYIQDGRNQICREVGCQNLPILHDEILNRRIPLPLYHATLDLALHLLWVDGPPNIVGRDHPHHVQLASLDIHLDLDGLGRIAEGNARIAFPRLLVERCCFPGVVFVRDDDRVVIGFEPALLGPSGSLDSSIAQHKRQARGGATAGLWRHGRIVCDQTEPVQRHFELVGHELGKYRVHTLPHVGRAGPHHNLLHVRPAVQLQGDGGFLVETETIADVFVATGDSHSISDFGFRISDFGFRISLFQFFSGSPGFPLSSPEFP